MLHPELNHARWTPALMALRAQAGLHTQYRKTPAFFWLGIRLFFPYQLWESEMFCVSSMPKSICQFSKNPVFSVTVFAPFPDSVAVQHMVGLLRPSCPCPAHSLKSSSVFPRSRAKILHFSAFSNQHVMVSG